MQFEYILVIIVAMSMIIFLYFFEPMLTRQKIKNNNEYGSARWATKKEINIKFRKEKISDIQESGFPIYFSRNKKYVWFDNKTPHWIHLGSTGSGKSVTSVIPNCSFIATAKIKKSVFITDPKGEIFDTTSQMFKDNGYEILTLDFRNPEYSNHVNLLEPAIREYELYNKNKMLSEKETNEDKKIEYKNKSITHFAECNQFVNDISKMIMNDETAKEKFWNNSSCDLLYGLIFLFLEEYIDGKIERKKITLTSIKKFQNSSMTETNNKALKTYMESKTYEMKSKDKLLPLLNISDTTYRSITSTFNERMTLYDDINVENITSNSDFEFDDLGKKPTVLYCCIPDESKIYYSLISIIVSLIYKTLVLLCNDQSDKRLPYELVFLLDEFANTPPLNDITTMVSVARSRGMTFNFYLQSLAQLVNLYGNEVSQIIQDNTGLAFLKTNTQSTADEISKRLGSKTIESNSLNYSLSLLQNNGSKNTSLMGRNLMTADEIKQLHYKTIIFSTIGYPVIRDTITYDKFSCYTKGRINRKIRPLERLVDTYFTVEQLNQNTNNNSNNQNPQIIKSTKLDKNNKILLEKIVKKILSLFTNVDYDVEYLKENNMNQAHIYLASPLSLSDITGLDVLSNENNFAYLAISSAEEVKRKNRCSKLEIYLKKEKEQEANK